MADRGSILSSTSANFEGLGGTETPVICDIHAFLDGLGAARTVKKLRLNKTSILILFRGPMSTVGHQGSAISPLAGFAVADSEIRANPLIPIAADMAPYSE